MKKLTALFLLVLLSYHSVGYYLLYEWKQVHDRVTLRQSLHTKKRPERNWFLVKVHLIWYHQADLPSANGAKGLVPAYGIWDFNMSLRFSGNYVFRLGINNCMNKQYFTKRPTFYPGPGVWSSDERSIVASFGVKL